MRLALKTMSMTLRMMKIMQTHSEDQDAADRRKVMDVVAAKQADTRHPSSVVSVEEHILLPMRRRLMLNRSSLRSTQLVRLHILSPLLPARTHSLTLLVRMIGMLHPLVFAAIASSNVANVVPRKASNAASVDSVAKEGVKAKRVRSLSNRDSSTLSLVVRGSNAADSSNARRCTLTPTK